MQLFTDLTYTEFELVPSLSKDCDTNKILLSKNIILRVCNHYICELKKLSLLEWDIIFRQ